MSLPSLFYTNTFKIDYCHNNNNNNFMAQLPIEHQGSQLTASLVSSYEDRGKQSPSQYRDDKWLAQCSPSQCWPSRLE